RALEPALRIVQLLGLFAKALGGLDLECDVARGAECAQGPTGRVANEALVELHVQQAAARGEAAHADGHAIATGLERFGGGPAYELRVLGHHVRHDLDPELAGITLAVSGIESVEPGEALLRVVVFEALEPGC